ncbi:amidohydrolase family protein [Hydrogenophaga sp. IBVHS1]|uniref:N-acyl-D-amino-acid deacylase family protein n=1 Tax=unclassified Hydrogenophaga TaxID=2610897 RepID=UPI000A2E538B|nr:amidohydrolase family protein [Hydrogenophaga sp. IBVHS1]OSZ74684.1 amidohydrolase [Hydrogenophaga sp. IBVHS1]
MKKTLDLVIRGGAVADGLGGPLIEADVAVNNGVIVQVGKVTAQGREEIDARHQVVAPGFVDIHTHYDGQAVWDQRFSPSSWHGVTTAVMGNCGVGFAPVRPQDRDRLIDLMEGVEDIPGVALQEGLDWAWESFADYLDALERKPHDIDFCAQLPHAALRVYVMGERASRLEMATAEDRARMRELTAEAMRAGAIGFSTSRSINHKSIKGTPTPTLKASEEELMAIAMGVKDAGRGVLQMITDFDGEDVDSEFQLMRRLTEASGRPLSFSLMQKHKNPRGWQRILELTRQANVDGLSMLAQVAPRGVGIMLGLQGSRNVFSECPSYQAIADLSLEERVEHLRQPAMRSALLSELAASAATPLGQRLVEFTNIFRFGNPPEYDPGPEHSLAATAAREGRTPGEVAYDLMMADDGHGTLYSPFANYAERNLNACGDMIAHPDTVIGLGDGGAHVGLVCDSSFQTFMLSHWGGPNGRFELPWLIKRQTSDTARAVGLKDRGVVAPGMKADLNVINPDQLGMDVPHMQFDLPAGGRRLMQRANGYTATIVSGTPVYRQGVATDALPGRLVRGPQAAPAL